MHKLSLKRIFNWINKKYPQNFIIQKPLIGTLIFLALTLGFVLLYKPQNLHEGKSFNFEITMLIYLSAVSIPVLVFIKILKIIPYFSKPEEWNILKDLASILFVLLGMGIGLYFMGFLMEVPAKRWNLATFINSCEYAVLIGIVPFLFFTVINYRHLFATESERNFNTASGSTTAEEQEKLIEISSQLKKEELSFYPSQFIYAESDGNYVVFFLLINNKVEKRIIRNSINTIADELSDVPYFIRTHRGFIVNIKKVTSQKGNTLAYRIKLEGVDDIIPVSRQNAREFDQVLRQYR